MMHSTLRVFVLGLITALATGLGALPFLFVRTPTPRMLGLAHALAAGLMLGASFGLIAEGSAIGAPETIAGAALGLLFIVLTERAMGDTPRTFGAVTGAGARRILFVLIIMTVHSFAEGVAVGVSFGGGQKLATLITIAIAVHNIPEGVAISAVMRSRGASVAACAAWSVVSSLPQPLMAVPSFLFVDAFVSVLPFGLGFAAGAMVYMVFLELLPDAFEEGSVAGAGLALSLALGLMVLFQHYL
jgi:zinc transporter ZupT